jgi:hypothetical protein
MPRAPLILTVGLAFATTAGLPRATAAQGTVTAQLSIPAPSPYLADWATSPAIAQLIVSNSTGSATPATVTVRFLQGGGRAGTVVGTGPSDITSIPSSPATVFLTPQIARWRDVVFTGAVGTQYRRTGRLPEGQYTLCVDFANMQSPTGGPIPNASGCGNFTVTYPQPPRLLAPANESQVAGPYPTFQWTPVITPGAPQVDYLFRLVEVLPGQTPLQAISGNVPLLEVPVHLITSFVYPPASLPLETGKHYAWRVQAVNALNNEPGQAVPVGANEGRSEIFTFTKGTIGPGGPPPVVVVAKKPPAPQPPGNKAVFPLFNATLFGTLRYTFKPGSVPAAKKVATPSPYQVVLPIMASLENPLPQGKAYMPMQQQAPVPPSPSMAIGVSGPPGPDPGPLAGVTVRLIVRYRTAKSAILTNPVWAGSQSYTDNGHIVATATTGEDGHFAFLFHDDPPTGVIAKNASVHWGSGDIAFGSESNASLVRYYNLEVGDGHFLNPSDELTLDSTKSGDVGTLISLVRSYNLVVRVVKQQNQSEAMPAVTVQLLRGERPAAVPENEGQAPAPRQLLGAGIPHMYYQVLPKWEILGQGETDVSGRFKLTRLVKNIGPSDQYRVRVSTPEGGLLYYETAFVTYAQNWPLFGPQGDATYFNEQYQTTRTDTLVIKLVPKKARYVGRLMRSDTLVPLPYGRADLCYNYTCEKRYVEPEDHGYFSFSDIISKTSVPPYWRVDVGSMGFIPQSKDSLALLLGTQHTGDVFRLQPDAHVRGHVVDEAGHPVFAYVQVDDGAWFKAQPAFVDKKGQAIGMQLSPGLFGGGGGGGVAVQQAKPPVMQQAQPNVPQAAQKIGGAGGVQGAVQAIGPIQANSYVFDFDAVSGTQHLRLMNDPKYFPVDTMVSIAKGDTTDLGTLTIFRRLHRLRLRVAIAGPPAGGPSPSIPGAVVQLDLSGHPTDTTDANGFAEFVWEAPNAGDSSVNVSIKGPEGKDFVGKSIMLQVPESRTWSNRTVALARGTSIAGRVFAGPSDSAPVPGARVFVDLGSDSASIETHTDSGGAYILHAVPIQTVVVRAGKSQSNFIGDSLVIAAKLPAVSGQNFHLQFYQGMDITRLLGFPMEVYSLQELPGDKALIRGALVQLPANTAFKAGVTALPFDSVTVQSDGTPAKHALPVAGALMLRDNELALDPFQTGAYIVKQAAATGLQVRPTGGSGSPGAVFGPIRLDVSASLTAVTSAEIDSLPAAYLLKPGATGDARSVVASITADSSAPVGSDGWNLGTAGGGRLHFRLYGFRADADSAASFLKADALYLRATLHTDIQGLPDLALQLPALKVAPGPGPGGGVKPASDSQAVDLKLGVWTLHASTWYLSPSEAKVYLSEGEIRVPPVPAKPQATIAFHFTGVTVTPTALGGGNFGTGPILLAGVVPLTSGQPIKFVMESPAGPWSLTALDPTIGGLPGMDPGSEIALDNFSFKSDGTTGMTLKGSAKVSYFHTADYAIKAMGVTETSVQFDGNLDLHVPNLPPNGFIFTYSKSGNGVQLAMPQLNYPAFDVGGASITLTNGKLDAGGFTSGGTLTVTGKWSIPIAFTRTPLNGTNQISAVPVPGATLGIGEVLVSQLTGGSKVASGQWSTAIDGHMDVNGGETSGPFHLDVAGSDVTIGSTGLQVKNISTPFGDIVITLDYPEQRIVGTLEIDHKELSPGTVVTGSAELAISGKPSNRYWYFFAGATADLSNPQFSATVAIVLGSATLSGQLLDKFNAYSNKGIPASFQTINGFFFEGKVVVPIPICPNGDIDVGVADIAIWCQVWGDLRLGMNFQQLNTYHIGVQVGADVGAKGGVGLGICLHVSGEVKADAGLEGEYRSDGAWYVLGEFNFSLHGEVSGGIGIDDVCIEASAGFTLGLHAEAQEGYNWNTGLGRHFSIALQ